VKGANHEKGLGRHTQRQARHQLADGIVARADRGAVAGTAAAGTWFLLTQEFSLPTLIFAVPLSLGYFIGEAVRTRYSVPAEQLTALD
jgi:hypothetical protein